MSKNCCSKKLYCYFLSRIPIYSWLNNFTLVEALALGIPVICSRNPNFEIDIDKEKIGITVEYEDVEGWVKAIQFMIEHPEEAKQMGKNARKLAEKHFNLERFSSEIAETLLSFAK